APTTPPTPTPTTPTTTTPTTRRHDTNRPPTPTHHAHTTTTPTHTRPALPRPNRPPTTTPHDAPQRRRMRMRVPRRCPCGTAARDAGTRHEVHRHRPGLHRGSGRARRRRLHLAIPARAAATGTAPSRAGGTDPRQVGHPLLRGQRG